MIPYDVFTLEIKITDVCPFSGDKYLPLGVFAPKKFIFVTGRIVS